MTENNTPESTNTMPDVQEKTGPQVDTYSYKGWMNSDSFIKRCFGVLGHYMMAYVIIVAAMGVIALGVAGILFLIGTIAG